MSSENSFSIALEEMFDIAGKQYSSIRHRWRNAIKAIDTLFPESTLGMSVQQVGQLDCVLRWLESEKGVPNREYQLLLSELWVMPIYEITRRIKNILKEEISEEMKNLHRDLALVRMPIAKHEIAGDRWKEPITLRKVGTEETIEYDPKKRDKTYIMSRGMVNESIVGWRPIDLQGESMPIIHRQNLSDRFLNIYGNSV
jgi:hypothetical protein